MVSVLLKIILRAAYLDLEGPDTRATSSSLSSWLEEPKETVRATLPLTLLVS